MMGFHSVARVNNREHLGSASTTTEMDGRDGKWKRDGRFLGREL